MAGDGDWIVIATLVGQIPVGHASAPAAALFKEPPENLQPDVGSVWIAFDDVTITGGDPGGAVVFWIWTLKDGIIEHAATYSVPVADSGFIEPYHFEHGDAWIYVTFDSAPGSESPSISGHIRARSLRMPSSGSNLWKAMSWFYTYMGEKIQGLLPVDSLSSGENPVGIGADVEEADPGPYADGIVEWLRLDTYRRLWVRLASQFTRTSGFEPPAVNLPAQAVYDVAPHLTLDEYSTAKGDGKAVRLSDATITFTGPTIVSSQIRKVLVDTGSEVRRLEQGHDGVYLSISGTTITVAGAGAAPVPAGSIVEVTWTAQNKAYDAATQAQREVPLFLTDSKYTDAELIVDVASVTKSDSVSYYPASTGIVMDGYSDIAFDISAVAGAGLSPLYVWLEACDDNTFPDATATSASPLNISPNCAVVNSIAPLGAMALTVTAGAKLRALWQIENINIKYVRVCFLNPAANAANANAVRMYARRKFQ